MVLGVGIDLEDPGSNPGSAMSSLPHRVAVKTKGGRETHIHHLELLGEWVVKM